MNKVVKKNAKKSAKPTDVILYNQVVSLGNKKFDTPSGIYRSSWIVREYINRGGKYTGVKPKNSGLKRWYKEKWVDLNRPIYKGCNSSFVYYPLLP